MDLAPYSLPVHFSVIASLPDSIYMSFFVQLHLKYLAILLSGNIFWYKGVKWSAVAKEMLCCTRKLVWRTSACITLLLSYSCELTAPLSEENEVIFLVILMAPSFFL